MIQTTEAAWSNKPSVVGISGVVGGTLFCPSDLLYSEMRFLDFEGGH
jgi:hypothetical protein